MKQTIKCPSCTSGYYPVLKPHKLIECFDCGATGEIVADPKWKKEGDDLRQYRLHVIGESLRDFCINRGLNPSEVSKVERGIIPAPDYLDTCYGL